MTPSYFRGGLEIPKYFQNHLEIKKLKSLNKNIGIPIVKPTFSEVGESVWDLKISPKEHRKQIKTNIGALKAIFDGKKKTQFQRESRDPIWSI